MGFSCTIKAGTKDLTKFDGGEIHYSLLGLGPNGGYATEAPYRVEDFRSAITRCTYGTKLKEAAIDCFREIQMMAKLNLESLKPEKHCETCSCHSVESVPDGWSADDLRSILAIDANSITSVEGSW